MTVKKNTWNIGPELGDEAYFCSFSTRNRWWRPFILKLVNRKEAIDLLPAVCGQLLAIDLLDFIGSKRQIFG